MSYQTHKTNLKLSAFLAHQSIKCSKFQICYCGHNVKISPIRITCKNSSATEPENLCILHLKHLGPAVIQYLTDICDLSTESKALAKSIARAAMREAGFGWLNPTATDVDRGSRAVVVECMGLKPCCVLLGVRFAVRCGRVKRSSTLDAGHRSDMSR